MSSQRVFYDKQQTPAFDWTLNRYQISRVTSYVQDLLFPLQELIYVLTLEDAECHSCCRSLKDYSNSCWSQTTLGNLRWTNISVTSDAVEYLQDVGKIIFIIATL